MRSIKPTTALALAAALAATAVSAAATSPESAEGVLPAPYGPAGNGSIAYSKAGDIWTADATGHDPAVLIGGATDDTYPYYSPDGTRFIFERREEGQPARVMVADAEGSDIVPIAEVMEDWWWSDWSPDSRSVLVSWVVDGERVISILSTDGSGAATTVDIGELEPEFVAWRPPDGQEIVFTAHDGSGSTDLGLYAVTPDGSGLRTIGVIEEGDSFQMPDLSPDGSVIAYWNWEAGIGAQNNLYARDLTTGATRALMLGPSSPGTGTTPVFSPDGEWLAFDTVAPAGTGDAQLVIAPIDGREPGRLIGEPYTYSEWGNVGWDFSPDGTIVLLNSIVADTEADMNTAGRNDLIDAATGVASQADEWMFGPSWQRLALPNA
jgi:Tol biopolymer transport system component